MHRLRIVNQQHFKAQFVSEWEAYKVTNDFYWFFEMSGCFQGVPAEGYFRIYRKIQISWFCRVFRGISWQTLHNSSCFATGLMFKMTIMSALVYSWNWFQNQSQTIFARGEVFTETMSLVANPGLMNPNVHVLCFKNKPSLILKEFKCKLIQALQVVEQESTRL